MSSVLFFDGQVFDTIALEKQSIHKTSRFINVKSNSVNLSENDSRRNHGHSQHNQQKHQDAHGRAITRANSDHHGHALNRGNESPQRNRNVTQRSMERVRSQSDLRANLGSADTINGFMSDS